METKGRRLSPHVRAEIRNSTESAREIARRHGVNLKTVLRWRHRDSNEARRSSRPRSESAAIAEALLVTLRRFARLSLDDCVHVLQALSAGFSRAAVHRCFRRYGISRLPETTRRPTQVGWFDVHALPLTLDSNSQRWYVAIERQSRFLFVDVGVDFLNSLQKASPVTVLGVCMEGGDATTAAFRREMAQACAGAAIRYRTLASSWPGAQHFTLAESVDIHALKSKLASFQRDFNHRCRLKTIGGRTPAAYIDRHPTVAIEGDLETPNMRERILECARSLLSTVGPEGMTLSKVARMAGVNRGTVYHHFPSRNELLAVAAEWSSEQLANAVFAAPFDDGEGQAGHSNVLRVIQRLANFAIRNPEMSQAWLMQITSMPDPSKDRFWREYYGRSRRFQHTPVPAQDMDPEVLAVITLAGTFLWPMWARAKSGDRANLQRYADRYVRECFRLMIHGTLRPEYAQSADAELRAMQDALRSGDSLDV